MFHVWDSVCVRQLSAPLLRRDLGPVSQYFADCLISCPAKCRLADYLTVCELVFLDGENLDDEHLDSQRLDLFHTLI